jgi:hypothetical protein
MVQDVSGEETETERLEVCLHKSRFGEDILESASTFTIKEPYFTFTEDGEATLRIDHPSDLIACQDQSANGRSTSDNDVSSLAEDATAAEESGRRCKDEGNAALQKQNIPLAHAKYTQGLEAVGQKSGSPANSDLARDLFRNRAHVNLLLNQLDEAITDATASLIGGDDQRSKELDSKANFRAGTAAYNLGEFGRAKDFFEEQTKLTPDDKSASISLRRTKVRLREQETGTYNWVKIRTGLSQARPYVDAATFLNNIEIGGSPGRGRGLFMTRDITAGEIVMCEKAFCMSWGHDVETLTAMTCDIRDDQIRLSPVGLSRSITRMLLCNPSQIARVLWLYGDYQGDGKNVSRSEDGPIVDTFRVHDIMSRNAFGPGSQFGEDSLRNASTGLWIHAAFINHSCIPNTKKEYMGDLMVLRAIRPITKGEEIFHSYDETSDYDARQMSLMATWGFECSCALCAAEKMDDPAVRKKRRELASDADAFLQREDCSGAKGIVIARARHLLKRIDETYNDERYKGLPRMASQRIREWLAKASPRR